MRIITTTGNRSINLILRGLDASNEYDVVLTNESTKEVTTKTVTATESAIDANMRQLSVPFNETYQEGDEMALKVVSGGVVLHRNKILVND